jgi:hypothetical protein
VTYKPDLPAGVMLPPGFRVNPDDPRFKALQELATREKWSQAAFSETLRIEADRVSAEHAKAAQPAARPAPAPTPGKVEGWDQMSSAQRMAYAVAASDARRAAGEKP